MNSLIGLLLTCFSERHLYNRLSRQGLSAPANLGHIWGKEPCAYVAAAILAVNQRGE